MQIKIWLSRDTKDKTKFGEAIYFLFKVFWRVKRATPGDICISRRKYVNSGGNEVMTSSTAGVDGIANLEIVCIPK